jgi:hypothetical protein
MIEVVHGQRARVLFLPSRSILPVYSEYEANNSAVKMFRISVLPSL